MVSLQPARWTRRRPTHISSQRLGVKVCKTCMKTCFCESLGLCLLARGSARKTNMAAQAKLMAALRKKESDDEAQELTPIEPTSDRDTLKMRKSSLRGVVSWEAALEKLDLNLKHDFAELTATVSKMFGNILSNPQEAKYRKIRYGNPNFTAKVWSMKGAPELFEVSGWKKDSVEAGFLVLVDTADVTLLQRALDSLTAQAAARAASEEKKRKLDAEAAKKARDARAQKAAEEANPAAYDAAVAGSSSAMVDEDEAMVEAVQEFMEAHPEIGPPGGVDDYAIERQVAGPGGTVVATVAASKGIQYYDLVAHMKRSEAGEWTVSKVEMEA